MAKWGNNFNIQLFYVKFVATVLEKIAAIVAKIESVYIISPKILTLGYICQKNYNQT